MIDTPGLFGSENLDSYYTALLEDSINETQKASALIITVGVSERLTDHLEKAVHIYRGLFSNKIKDMLYVVITLLEPASEERCKRCTNFYLPLIMKAAGDDCKGVLCVSLHDLREEENIYSHIQIGLFRKQIMDLEMILIDEYEQLLRYLDDLINGEAEFRAEKIQKLVEINWKRYRHFAKKYEKGERQGLVSKNTKFDGFVFRAEKEFGIHWVRESLHVKVRETCPKYLWNNFYSTAGKKIKNVKRAMHDFETYLRAKGFAVFVNEDETRMFEWVTVKRTFIDVYDPEVSKYEDFVEFINNLKEKHPEVSPEFWAKYKDINLDPKSR